MAQSMVLLEVLRLICPGAFASTRSVQKYWKPVEFNTMVFFGATDEYPNGQLNPGAYMPFALACAPIMVLGIWLAALGTHGQIANLDQPKTVRNQLWRGVIEDVTTAFKIPAFVAVVAGSIMFSISQGMVQALHLYLATYFFELSSTQITFLFAGAITGIIVGSLCSRPMATVIPEKRDLFIAGKIAG